MMTVGEMMQNGNVVYPLAGMREMEYPFGWIPRRFATDGIMETLSGEEISLYIFLAIVSDNCGISYYGDKKICRLAGLTNEALVNARFMLEQKEFITYKKPFYHVLKMPQPSTRAAKSLQVGTVSGSNPCGTKSLSADRYGGKGG